MRKQKLSKGNQKKQQRRSSSLAASPMETIRAMERVRAAVPVETLVAFHPIGHVDEYIKFLTLKLLCDDVDALPPALSPSHPVDQVWHTHMLHPHEYVRTCQSLLPDRGGAVFKHSPIPRADSSRYEKTLDMYEESFGVPPNPAVWPDETPASPPPSAETTPERPRKRASREMISIVVKTLTGRHVQFNFAPSDSIADLKLHIEDSVGIPPEQQRIIYKGMQLEDGRTLSDYQVSSGDLLHLLQRLRGC